MAETNYDSLPTPGVGYPTTGDLFAISPIPPGNTYKFTIQQLSNFVANYVPTNWIPSGPGINGQLEGIDDTLTGLATPVVSSWNGSTSPVAVTAGAGISITGGTITNTSSPSTSSSAVYVPALVAGSGVNAGVSLQNVTSRYTTVNIAPGNIVTVYGYIQFIPFATACTVFVTTPIGLGAIFTAATDAFLVGAVGYIGNTQQNFAQFRNTVAIIGNNQFTVNLIVPSAAINQTYVAQYTVNYIIR